MTRAFGMSKAKYSAVDVFNGKVNIETAITRYNAFIDVLQAGEAMSTFEFDILPNIKRYENPFDLLRPHIDQIRGQYDYIFIDTPPSLSIIVGNVFVAADYLLIPFIPEPFALDGLSRVINTVKEFSKAGNEVDIMAVVPMMIDNRTSLHSELLQQARRYCMEQNVIVSIQSIPRGIQLPKATQYENMPVTMGKQRNSEVSKAYYALMEELKEHESLSKAFYQYT